MIKIILTAYNMGPDTAESDFDAWAAYVAEEITEALDLGDEDIEIHQASFANAPADDVVIDATEEQTEAILRWLGSEGWEAFCGTAFKAA